MMVRFDGTLQALVLCASRETARTLVPDGDGWTERWSRLDREGAYRLLAQRRDRAETLAEARRALAAEGLTAGRGALDDETVLTTLAERLAGGWVVEIDRRAPVGGWHSDAPAPPEPVPDAVQPDPKPTGVPARKTRDHWITVELVGEDGGPVPNEPVTVTDPAGEEHAGETDSQGQFTVTGIPEGDCQITFPDLDQEAWEAAANG
ncbi:hypothetical protein KAJ83_03070 [Marivibrio halodurans]|uniref:Carboxypeptidase regulatory-like domain-containing protein n=1 Tax=Marivibrio halodurans TaxID=2039722 RepID=A0A8J7RZL9_9PROT|nr:hypothetical protein [Marivibrio halodurans]MBP5855974.1 hypothetical protein [Marivibrio halodurans]